MSREIFLEYSFADLVRNVRRSLGGITQEKLAQAVGAASSSVRNWEQGVTRPAPKHLRKMAELSPQFAPQISRMVESYEWRPQSRVVREHPEMDLLRLVPTSLRASLRALAKKTKLDISLLLRHALDLGITSLTSQSSRDLEALVERQSEINREAYEQLTHTNQKKNRRSRVA